MKYPNLRYGNPNEFAAYIQGIPVKEVARRLRRSERCIRNWLAGREKMPWWAPEIVRLQDMEHRERLRQMNIAPLRAKLGLVDAKVLHLPKKPPVEPENAPDVVELPRFQHGR